MGFLGRSGFRPRVGTLTAAIAGVLSAVASGSAVTPTFTGTLSADLPGPTATGSGSISGTVTTVDVTTFTVEGSGSKAMSFALPFKPGQIPSGQVPVITDAFDNPVSGAQAQVRATHADGSVRHAMLHGAVTGGQSYKIRTGLAPGGANKTVADFLAAVSGSIARVLVTGGLTGTCDLRDLLSSATNRAVMTHNATANLRIVEAGPSVLIARVAQNVGTHLRVNFEVRWYGGTVYWVDVFVVNGYSTLNGMAAANYSGQVEINGSVITTQSFAVTNHYNHSVWHPSQQGYWSGAAADLYVRHNTQYIQDTGAVPNYRRTQVPTTDHMNNLPQSCAAMDNCEMRDALDGGGAGEELCLLPRWCANYIKSNADIRCFRNMLANDEGGGSYPTWFLNHNNGEFMTENEFPNASYNQGIGFGSGMFTGQSPFGTSSVNSHLPSVGYVSYLVTGSQFFLEMMNAWTSEANLWNSTNRNRTFGGRTIRQHYEQSIRGMAWQYRTNGHSAYVCPDNHFLKAQWVAWVDGVATLVDGPFYGPGGTRRNALGGMYEGDAGTVNYSLFYHLFFCQATGWLALDLGFTSVLPVAQYAGILVAGLFGRTGEFPFEVATRDRIKLGTTDASVPAESAIFYSSLAEVRTQNGIAAGESGTLQMAGVAQALRPGEHSGARNECWRQSINDSYFANFLPALSFLHRLGVDGGLECWVRSTLCTIQPDFGNAGQWDIGPREVPLPAYIRNAAPLTWTKIANSAMPILANFPGSLAARTDAWGGGSKKHIGSVYFTGPYTGHADGGANSVESFRFNSEAPSWTLERTFTSPPGPSNVAYFSDGRPNARHVYYDQHFHQGRNLHFSHGASATWMDAIATFPTVDGFSPVTKDWLGAGALPDSVGAAGAGMKAMNLANGCVYYLNASSNDMFFRRYSIVNGVTQIGGNIGEFGAIYKAGACDPIRGVVLHARGSGQTAWRSYSIDTAAFTNRFPDATGGLTAGQITGLQRSSGIHDWDIRGKRYIHYSGGQDACAIDPVTFAASPIVLAGTPPPATVNNNGLLSRGGYIPELDIFVAQSQSADGWYFFKFSDSQRPM